MLALRCPETSQILFTRLCLVIMLRAPTTTIFLLLSTQANIKICYPWRLREVTIQAKLWDKTNFNEAVWLYILTIRLLCLQSYITSLSWRRIWNRKIDMCLTTLRMRMKVPNSLKGHTIIKACLSWLTKTNVEIIWIGQATTTIRQQIVVRTKSICLLQTPWRAFKAGKTEYIRI